MATRNKNCQELSQLVNFPFYYWEAKIHRKLLQVGNSPQNKISIIKPLGYVKISALVTVDTDEDGRC